MAKSTIDAIRAAEQETMEAEKEAAAQARELASRTREDAEALIREAVKKAQSDAQALIEAAVRAVRMAENGMDGKKILCVRPDQLGRWPDVCADADIVVYNSPLSCSCFRYLPKYAAGRAFLPLMVWDDSVPDGAKRLDACRYVWKILPKDAGTVAELRKESGVQNAENVFQRGKKHYEQSF